MEEKMNKKVLAILLMIPFLVFFIDSFLDEFDTKTDSERVFDKQKFSLQGKGSMYVDSSCKIYVDISKDIPKIDKSTGYIKIDVDGKVRGIIETKTLKNGCFVKVLGEYDNSLNYKFEPNFSPRNLLRKLLKSIALSLYPCLLILTFYSLLKYYQRDH